MSSDGWYYCLAHHSVETLEGCKAIDRLGPYPAYADAARALERVAERNEAWEEQDRKEREERSGRADD